MGLRVALTGAQPDDPILQLLPSNTELVHDGDRRHRAASAMLASSDRVDLLLTTSSLLPDQAPRLVSLESLVDPSQFANTAIRWCTVAGRLVAVPRSLEVRLLCVRSDMVLETPRTWTDVMAGGATFGLATRGPGAVASFVEALGAAGGRLDDDEGRPQLATAAASRAVAELLRLCRDRGPRDMASWSTDDADNALAAGRVAMGMIGTGGYARARRARVRDDLWLHHCPGGQAFGSAAAWAVPTTCHDLATSLELVQLLTSASAQSADARRFVVPARLDSAMAAEPLDSLDERRLELVGSAVAHGLVTLPRRPGWARTAERMADLLARAYRGELLPGDTVAAMQRAACRSLDVGTLPES